MLKEMLLDIHEEHREDWIKIINKVWENRDSERSKDFPFILKETPYHYNSKGKMVANEWAKLAGKVDRKCKIGRVIDKFAFVYDRPVQDLEYAVFRSIYIDIFKNTMNENNYTHLYNYSNDVLADLTVAPHDVVISSVNYAKKLNFEVDYVDKNLNSVVMILKGMKGVEFEWSWRPVFFYGPKNFTANEYRYILSREHVDTNKFKGFAYIK